MATLFDLLKLMIESGASDLHITTGSPPRMRIAGRLISVEDYPALTPEDSKDLCYSVLSESQTARLEEDNEVDLSFGIRGMSRFRADIYMQRGTVAGSFRAIPFTIKTLMELGLPDSVGEITRKPHGLILVTGPSQSGKTTTIASMIDTINSEREALILTVEDPVEFLHTHKKGLVNQREVNSDTASFRTGLQYIMRQDPDVVYISEMHDEETIEAALSLAETGHLVLATMHTITAVQTIDRILDFFSSHQQEKVRGRLSAVLEGIICQQLVPESDGQQNVLALEVLIPTPAIRGLIRGDKIGQIYSLMQTCSSSGMQTMNQSLHDLHK
ncbi:MAG: PilT/PilU family type 4a pilus ATPase, partial [Nitrospirales bacterium]|nr:PilT/PilU family type 4a pilus ATPase [Nitrospirales bacterium]